MGTHGRRGFNRWMFGSVAEGALRRAKRPFLLIRSGEAEG
jgi:nucleotide-binding universal stress UspA family protein